ncbi:hypothetical protein KR038_002587 [Drosophila bunnanda]|nr:hypothetical protein KR038_002587 [Drosophila bunnanda]
MQTATNYSADGRIMQIEYATKAVNSSFTAIGIRGKDSVVLAVDKIVRSSLYEPDADRRILTLERNIGMAIAGFTPDGQVVAEFARQEASIYRMQFCRGIPLKELCQRVASYIHGTTVNGFYRPLGLSVILASWDEVDGPQLYKVEPSGSFLGYYACAIGRARSQAIREFDKLEIMSGMKTEKLVKSAGQIIYKGHYDRQERDFLFEMGVVGRATGGLHFVNPPGLTAMARFAGVVAVTLDSSSSDD